MPLLQYIYRIFKFHGILVVLFILPFPFEGGDQTRRSFEAYLGRAMVEQNYQHSFLIWIEGRRDVILENYAFVA